MSKELVQNLLEAGVHFGHQTRKWNPKMKQYIYGEKNGIYIIDLDKTAEQLKSACDFMRKKAADGELILFVGTKQQASEIIESEAKRCGMFYVNHRWLGGMLTNYQTIKNSIRRYKSLIQMRDDGTYELLTKKEIAEKEKEIVKLEKNLAGVVQMERLPGAIFIVDAKNEAIAIAEANVLDIPVVALVDTDSDPSRVHHVVPGNDDAIRSIKLVTSVITDSILEGLRQKASSDAKDKSQERESQMMAAKTQGA